MRERPSGILREARHFLDIFWLLSMLFMRNDARQARKWQGDWHRDVSATKDAAIRVKLKRMKYNLSS
jgi:hypothetical protein